MGKTKEKTWMLIIETKSYRGLSCYRKVLFVSAPDHQFRLHPYKLSNSYRHFSLSGFSGVPMQDWRNAL